MSPFNIYIVGVGGQGVGLMASALSAAVCDAGFRVLCADTHGIAQRGGISSSHLRIGRSAFHPLISPHCAHLVIALERLEALRGAEKMLAGGGRVFYLDTVFQPATVRMGEVPYPSTEDVEAAVSQKRGRLVRVPLDSLDDKRMGNTLLVAHLIHKRAVPGLTLSRILGAMSRSLPDVVYKKNRDLLVSALEGIEK